MIKSMVSLFFVLFVLTMDASEAQASRLVFLDGSQIESTADFYEELNRVLEFPEWQGNNLDALFDSLIHYSQNITLIVYGAKALKTVLSPEYFEKIIDVFSEAKKEGSSYGLSVFD